MADIAKILDAYGTMGVLRLQQALRTVEATGATVDSIRQEVKTTDKSDVLRIYGRQFIDVLEKGRRPTSKNPSPEMIKLLTDYAKARGMDKPESAAWAMAKKMNKDGDRTYKKGGRIVYSDVLQKLVDELKEACKQEFLKGFKTQIRTLWQ